LQPRRSAECGPNLSKISGIEASRLDGIDPATVKDFEVVYTRNFKDSVKKYYDNLASKGTLQQIISKHPGGPAGARIEFVFYDIPMRSGTMPPQVELDQFLSQPLGAIRDTLVVWPR
jgi:hypothetical protein